MKSPQEMTQAERLERWPNFTDSEMACSCCNTFSPSPQFSLLMDDAQTHRTSSGLPLPINSGYRCPQHPIEAKKKSPGEHSIAACDFGVQGEPAIRLLHFFLDRGYVGFGVYQSGNTRYLHVDRRRVSALWSK